MVKVVYALCLFDTLEGVLLFVGVLLATPLALIVSVSAVELRIGNVRRCRPRSRRLGTVALRNASWTVANRQEVVLLGFFLI